MATSRSSWKQFERRIARAVGGVRVPTSGGMKSTLIQLAGDVISDYVCIECKFSGAQNRKGRKRITVRIDWIPKIVQETKRIGPSLIPVLVIHFKGSRNNDWAFIRASDLKELSKGEILADVVSKVIEIKNNKKSFTLYETDLAHKVCSLGPPLEGWVVIPFTVLCKLLVANKKIGCSKTLQQYTFLRTDEPRDSAFGKRSLNS